MKTSDEIESRFRNMPPADWVLEMRNFYNKNGYYKSEHLRRLLGYWTKSVSTDFNDFKREITRRLTNENIS
jgi:hypothetical protein